MRNHKALAEVLNIYRRRCKRNSGFQQHGAIKLLANRCTWDDLKRVSLCLPFFVTRREKKRKTPSFEGDCLRYIYVDVACAFLCSNALYTRSELFSAIVKRLPGVKFILLQHFHREAAGNCALFVCVRPM